MTEPAFRSFSGLQFYLAHANNMVHVMFELNEALDAGQFEKLTRRVLRQAPQLLWEESVADGGYRLRKEPEKFCALLRQQDFPSTADADRALDDILRQPLSDSGSHAFRAVCQTIGSDADRKSSRVIFQSTHGILEGGDVAGVLRGRPASRDLRRIDDTGLSLPERIGSSLLVPILWPAHMLAAMFEKRDPDNFGFQRFILDRSELKGAAQALDIGQREMLFALSSEAFRRCMKPGKTLSVTYSTLPTERRRLVDDEYLNVRMDDVSFRPGATFDDYARDVASALQKRGRNPVFVATLQRKLVRLHQWIHRHFPSIYPRRFFGFAPQDLVLSLLPPIKPGRFSPALADATVFAGSNTGTANCCIFVVSDRHVGMTFWTEAEPAALAKSLAEIGKPLGLSIQPPIVRNATHRTPR